MLKKQVLFLALAIALQSESAKAQNTTCGAAVNQLQNYAAQVNQYYSNEYWRIIPGARCPAYDQWGRPFHPQIVQNCRLQMLAYLNQWYGQQCAYVNSWYVQIVYGCALEQPKSIRKPAPSPKPGSDENGEIDTEEIDELTAGIDEDKALKISIPKTASGFKPRN